MKLSYWIVIVSAGDEPMAVSAANAAEIRAQFGDVALCAATTRAALLRAGWTDESIHRAGTPTIGPDVVYVDAAA